MAKTREIRVNIEEVKKARTTKQITEALAQGVKATFTSENYVKALDMMSKMHKYSFNNLLLIMAQKPEASLIFGFHKWKEFDRKVKKGEKAITILAPVSHTATKEKTNKETGEKEDTEVSWLTFRPVPVFDVSQTDGKEVPTLCKELDGSVDGYKQLMDKLIALSPVPVDFEDIRDGAKGYFAPDSKRIAINTGMSEMQTVKTLIHEIAHAILHNREVKTPVPRRTQEVQAESVAYVVANALGIDTASYSFEYIASWSKGKEVKELSQSMEVIRKTADKILKEVA